MTRFFDFKNKSNFLFVTKNLSSEEQSLLVRHELGEVFSVAEVNGEVTTVVSNYLVNTGYYSPESFEQYEIFPESPYCIFG